MIDERINELVTCLDVPYSTEEELTNVKNVVKGYMEKFQITNTTAYNMSEMYTLALMQLDGKDRQIKQEQMSRDIGESITELINSAGARECELTYINSDTSWDDFSDWCSIITFTSVWDIKAGTEISQIIGEQIEAIVRPITKHGYRFEVYGVSIDEVNATPVVRCRTEIMLDWAFMDELNEFTA
jgi:hypothetical protein